MLFNTLDFWLFFVIVYGVYRLLGTRGQNLWLLGSSYVFYSFWDYRFLAHYTAQLDRLRVRTDILFVAASRLGPLPEGNFIDFTHVDSNGRRLVSERLREILRPEVAPPVAGPGE